MTVSSVSPKVVYLGNGSQTGFEVPFAVSEKSDLVLVVKDVGGNYRTLSQGEFSVVRGAGSGLVSQVVLSSPVGMGAKLVVMRDTSIVQSLDIHNQGEFLAEALEAALDRIVMIEQDLAERLGRAMKYAPDVEGGDGYSYSGSVGVVNHRFRIEEDPSDGDGFRVFLSFSNPDGSWGAEQDVRGPKGAQGVKGDTLVAVSVGQTYTLSSAQSAYVNNVGSSSNAVLNFGIPKGEQGLDGAHLTSASVDSNGDLILTTSEPSEQVADLVKTYLKTLSINGDGFLTVNI